MKLAIAFKTLAFATLTTGVFVNGADSGLRGGTEMEPSTERNLQTAQSSARTPFTQNAEVDDNGGLGAVFWPLGNFGNRPAFSKMSFDLAQSGDINIDQIRVDPDTTGPRVHFGDRDGAEDYRYSVTGVELPANTEYVLFLEKNAVGCFNSPPQPEVPGKVPVLQGFAVNYARSNFDRNVQHLRVQVDTLQGTNQPIIRVCHADFNDDDAYNLAVRYALVDEALVFGFDEFSNVKGGGGLDASVVYERPSNTVAIINGFDLEFLSGDRDLADLLVEVNQDGRLYVNFKDQTNDDSYRWKVDVAYIGAEAI